MKKFLSAGLAVLMLTLCTVSAFASSMQITTHSEVDYQLSYPADVEIPWESPETVIGAITAEKMLIEPQKCVAVTVASANDYKLVNVTDAEKSIAYTLSGADAMVFAPGEVGKSFPLAALVTEDAWATAAAGEHKDVLTFTAEYKNQ